MFQKKVVQKAAYIISSFQEFSKILSNEKKLYITAILKTQQQAIYAVAHLKRYGISKDSMSMVGRSIPTDMFAISDTSLFNMPSFDKVIVAGSLRIKLLQLISQASGSGVSSGLVFLFISLSMPVEKAAQYQTCLQNGNILILIDADPRQKNVISTCLDAAGAKDIFQF